MAHTLGPWFVRYDEGAGVFNASFFISTSPEDESGTVLARLPTGRYPEYSANASLIAAAPDLLAALKQARAALVKAGHHAGISGALISIDNAIAKARGEA